jgi:hypothetical protein
VTGTSTVPYMGTNLPCSVEPTAVVYDTATGQLVWYQTLDDEGKLGLLNMVQFTADHTILGEVDSAVVEVDLHGNELFRMDRGIDYHELLHHDLFKWNGWYYLLYQEPGIPVLDGFVVVDGAGVELARWRAADHLAIPLDAVGDWLHTNTLWVDGAGDVYLSAHAQNTILKVNGDVASADFGELLWSFEGSLGGIGQDFFVDWSAIDGDDGFVGQHDVHLRADGRLTLLDNANGRALVFTVDEATRSATADESWATLEPSCGPQGTAADTPVGNAVVACSGRSVREWDAAQAVEQWRAEVVCPLPTPDPGAPGLIATAVRWYPLGGW